MTVIMPVEPLKAIRKEEKKLFSSFVSRRNAVRTIISNIENKLDDDIRDVNNQISNCASELSQGLKGVSKISQIYAEINSAKEQGAGADLKISECRSNLNKEASRCQGEINTLDSEIKKLENQIKACGGTIHFWE